MSETLKQIMAERDLSRAITALYLEVDESIVNDIRIKVDAAFQSVRDERDRLAELVRQAQPHVCSLLCPSVKARHELWTHTKLCLNMQAALTPAGGGKREQHHPAFDEYGEHRQPTGLGDL